MIIMNLKCETESVSVQNYALRTKYGVAKIDNTQKNRKCWQYRDKYETVDYRINECSKQT